MFTLDFSRAPDPVAQDPDSASVQLMTTALKVYSKRLFTNSFLSGLFATKSTLTY